MRSEEESFYYNISVIVPVRNYEVFSQGKEKLAVLKSIKEVDYPKEKIEVIIAEGKNPPLQRNVAAKSAVGELLFFFDDDCYFEPHLFKKFVEFYHKIPDLAGVGGIALVSKDTSASSKLTHEVLCSWLGGNIIRKRHKEKKDYTLPAKEDSLILCNLSIKKEIFLKEGGFKTLYPGEENEFLTRLTEKGYIFCAVGDAKVYRRWKKNIFELLSSLFRYGKSRMLIILSQRKFNFDTLPFLCPPVFFLYIVTLILFPSLLYSSLLGIYLILILLSSLFIAWRKKSLFYLNSFFFFPIVHILYAIGEIYGLVYLILVPQKNREEIDDSSSKIRIIKLTEELSNFSSYKVN
jgi:GT2 family glycosyltransferase